MSLLSGLTPQPLWSLFEELTRIPRASGHEGQAVQWLKQKGALFGCEVEFQPLGPDPAVGNVLLRKPATPGREGRPGVILQAHIDMVCVRGNASTHDFSRDPLVLQMKDHDLYATDTTLGADNGIGVCAALAVLASQEVEHGPLEVLITVDEESGLTGAQNLRPNWLRGRYLLNLDSEDEGELTIGCAGGVDNIATRQVSRVAAPSGAKCVKITLEGMNGGHSGMAIGKAHCNALRLLVHVLRPWMRQFGLSLASFQGGKFRNAIPAAASATVWVPDEQVAGLERAVAEAEAFWQKALKYHPKLRLHLTPAEADSAVAEADTRVFLDVLQALPHGVEGMSPEVPGLVETSTNLATAEIRGDTARVTLLTRSSVEVAKAMFVCRIDAIFRMAGFAPRTENNYVGWEPLADNFIVKLCDETHRSLFGKPATIAAVHAGLECGVIGATYPDIEMVSFGPTIREAHTPEENVHIPSVTTFWQLLTTVLGRV
ncbi:MAG: beta-Ala-His dipeptidase [Prosthecobacter sp.]